MAYEKVTGPLGPDRTDHYLALICATLANVNREKNQRPYKVGDFLTPWDGQAGREAESWEQMLATVQGITSTYDEPRGGEHGHDRIPPGEAGS